MRRDSSFCAKSVRYNIFTNGAPYYYRRLLQSECRKIIEMYRTTVTL